MYYFEYWCTNGTHNKSQTCDSIVGLVPHITSLMLKVMLNNYPLCKLYLKHDGVVTHKVVIDRPYEKYLASIEE